MTRSEAARVEDALNYLGTCDAYRATAILTELLQQARLEFAVEDAHHDYEEAVTHRLFKEAAE